MNELPASELMRLLMQIIGRNDDDGDYLSHLLTKAICLEQAMHPKKESRLGATNTQTATQNISQHFTSLE